MENPENFKPNADLDKNAQFQEGFQETAKIKCWAETCKNDPKDLENLAENFDEEYQIHSWIADTIGFDSQQDSFESLIQQYDTITEGIKNTELDNIDSIVRDPRTPLYILKVINTCFLAMDNHYKIVMKDVTQKEERIHAAISKREETIDAIQNVCDTAVKALITEKDNLEIIHKKLSVSLGQFNKIVETGPPPPIQKVQTKYDQLPAADQIAAYEHYKGNLNLFKAQYERLGDLAKAMDATDALINQQILSNRSIKKKKRSNIRVTNRTMGSSLIVKIILKR